MYLTRSQEREGNRYIETMNDLLGGEIRSRSRRHDLSWGRFIVADALQARLGFTASAAAQFLDRDHSTSVHWKRNIKTMLEYPVMYAYENELYIDFNSRI